MQKIFRKYLFFIMVCITAFMVSVNYYMVSRELERRMVTSSKSKMEQIFQMLDKNEIELKSLQESLSEDYLTRCQAFAYIIKEDPSVLEDQQELQRVKCLLNVDELHVTDENGILRWGTIPKYFGMDFATTEQTKPFLEILKDPEQTLVQDIQLNGMDRKMFQYVGVAREDRPGIVQVGLNPKRYMAAKERNELSYIFENIIVSEHQFICAVDKDTNIILGDTYPQYNGMNIVELGVPEDYAVRYENGGFIEYEGQKIFYVTQQYEDIIICAGEPENKLYAERSDQMRTILVCFFVAFIVTMFSISRLLERKIGRGVKEIVKGVAQIQKGNLETIIQVDSAPEFRTLSDGINRMVEQIVHERDYDSLTGLRNRRSFEQQVCAHLQSEDLKSAAMVMMDLDNFKSVNDRYGHAFGDEYLKAAAEIMRNSFGETCIIGRRSGDEFYMFWQNCGNMGQVMLQMEKFYENLRKNPISLPTGEKKAIGISSGVTFSSQAVSADFDELLSKADAAMYRAKEDKKGSCFAEKED